MCGGALMIISKKKLFFSFILMLQFSFDEIVEEIYFIVNDEIITKMDYEEREQVAAKIYFQQEKIFGDTAKQQVISNMIFTLLIKQEAKKNGIIITPQQVSNQIRTIIEMNDLGSIENLINILPSQGLSWDQFYSMQEISLYNQYLQGKLGSIIEPSEKEIKEYYQKNKEEFRIKETLPHISLIFIEKEKGMSFMEISKIAAEAKNLKNQLDKDPSQFEKLATEFSDDYKTKSSGGLQGWVTLSDFTEEPKLWKKINQIGKNEISDVLDTKKGFYIIKVNDLKATGYLPLSKARNLIIQNLAIKKREKALDQKLTEIKLNAVVEKKTENFPNFIFN